MPSITLKSNDGKIFETDVDVIKCSGTIQSLLETCCMGDEDGGVIPLPKVDAATLERILHWADHHKTDPELTEGDLKRFKAATSVAEWDAEFLQISLTALYQLYMAANYLDIKGLAFSCSLTLALMFKGKTTEQLRNIFNIRNDFSDTEQPSVRLANEW